MTAETVDSVQQPQQQLADFSPARKPTTYDLIGRLNAAFARVHKNLELLEQVGIFDAYAMARVRNTATATQADANYTLIDTLRIIEQRDRKEFKSQADFPGQ